MPAQAWHSGVASGCSAEWQSVVYICLHDVDTLFSREDGDFVPLPRTAVVCFDGEERLPQVYFFPGFVALLCLRAASTLLIIAVGFEWLSVLSGAAYFGRGHDEPQLVVSSSTPSSEGTDTKV